MYISLNWVKEFVDLDGISDEEIVSRLNMATCEVESVTKKGADIDDVVVAEIIETRKYEGSDHLNIMKVDDGSGEYLQILTGAPNVYNGMKTFLVRVGGMVGGHTIKLAKLAGQPSYGMCCSEAELGIGSDDEGIVDYKGDAKVGTPIKEILPIEDTIIEIENKSLSNRPDLWGQYGFAREIACIFDRKLKDLKTLDLSKFEGLKKVDIKIDNKACYYYSAITIDGINEHVSPDYMKIRLNYCGMRDINLLADMTNYIMLEVGQPMHAFDNDVVKGINVISGDGKAKIETLEGEKHVLPAGSIVIADSKKNPVAIAGIKGGLLSGITEKTNSLLLESATFDAATIRKTAKKIGLITDASLRYEKSLDTNLAPIATARLLYLLSTICKGMRVTSAFSEASTFSYPKRTIKFNRQFICARGGADVSSEYIANILKKLGFNVKNKDDEFEVVVPSFRATKDITIKEDIVEEIFRIYGYDNIVPKTIKSEVLSVEKNRVVDLEYRVKRFLAEKYNSTEIHTYVWNYADFNKYYGIASEPVVSLLDSSNSGQSGIRREMIPSLLKAFYENKNNFDEFVIDEIGSVASALDENKKVIESRRLAILTASNKKSAKEEYFLMKQILLDLTNSVVNSEVTIDENVEKPKYMHPANSAGIVAGGNVIGYFGLVHPEILSKMDQKYNVAVLELDFVKLCENKTIERKFKPVSKFQTVSMDFNFLVSKEMKYSEIEHILGEFRCKYDVTHKLIDVYENKETLGDNKSITIGFDLSPMDHTLSSNEIDTFRKRLLDHMKRFGISLR